MEKKTIMILSNRDINPLLFKSRRYKLRRLIYFDAIFEHLSNFKKEEINKITAIIVDERLFRGNDFFKTIKLLKNSTKDIKVAIILKKYNYVLKEKLLNLGIDKIFIEERPDSLPMTDVVAEYMDDPFILNYLEKEKETLLRDLVFSIEEVNKDNFIKKSIKNIRKSIFKFFYSINKKSYKNIIKMPKKVERNNSYKERAL